MKVHLFMNLLGQYIMIHKTTQLRFMRNDQVHMDLNVHLFSFYSAIHSSILYL